MQTYQATVKVRNQFGCMTMVQTRVIAQSPYHANTLLVAQYGQGNVVIYPTQCD